MSFRSELNVDLYELTMAQVYWRRDINGRATFSLFFRGYPKDRGYYIACGIDNALEFLEEFRLTQVEIDAIRETTPLADEFIDSLIALRFRGDVRAVPEGSIVFADEPVLEVTADVIEAQIVETMLLNTVTTANLLATKASRIVSAAAGRPVVDFGSRRTHGEDAALQAARSGYIAGFAGTSNVKAAARFGIPAVGTMAHSFVQTFDDERAAFEAYVREFPDASTLLVDTYDTMAGVANAVRVARQAQARGASVGAIRLDSGNLAELPRSARAIFDAAGLHDVRILASGGLDEHSIEHLVSSDAPIDAFGVGTRYGTSADAPFIDSVYKLVEFDGQPIVKLSSGKQTHPWSKQVNRRFREGVMTGDLLTRSTSPMPKDYPHAMLRTMMKDGRRLKAPKPIGVVRNRVASNLATLPDRYRKISKPDRYPVEYSPELDIPN